MLYITLANMSEYPVVVSEVIDNGVSRTPRGLTTVDAGYTIVEIDDVRGGLPLGVGRKINPAIGAIEALQLIGAVSKPDLLLNIAPQFKRYMDGGSFHGSYGKRIRMQLPNVCRKLQEDPNTRQAVITLWDPALDNLIDKHDYPCTVALHFEMDVSGRLCMNTTMRSNDVWLGFPYDVFQFTQLQLTLANVLNVAPGPYRHTTWSMHLYERNFEAAYELLGTTPWKRTYDEFYQPHGLGDLRSIDRIDVVIDRARRILDQRPWPEMTKDEGWFYDVINRPAS
jgi:thymidylate synthase